MRNRVLCNVPEKERQSFKELLTLAQPVLKAIQKCCDKDISKLEIIDDDDLEIIQNEYSSNYSKDDDLER